MTAVEVILILIGVAFLIGSHFVQERFSEKEVQEIAKMSELELKTIVDKQVRSVKIQVENSVEEIIDESLEITKRGLEKETNEKIMAVSEYSDTVLETMNKTHNEIMFLYSMLNDKHTEMTEFVGAIQKYSKSPNVTVTETTKKVAEPIQVERSKEVQMQPQPVIEERQVVAEAVNEAVTEDTALINKNEQILLLHKEGKTEVEIAKALDCGLGEVRLVLGLFKEE